MKLKFTNRFVKGFKKLDSGSQKILSVALKQMEEDLTNKSIRVKKKRFSQSGYMGIKR